MAHDATQGTPCQGSQAGSSAEQNTLLAFGRRSAQCSVMCTVQYAPPLLSPPSSPLTGCLIISTIMLLTVQLLLLLSLLRIVQLLFCCICSSGSSPAATIHWSLLSRLCCTAQRYIHSPVPPLPIRLNVPVPANTVAANTVQLPFSSPYVKIASQQSVPSLMLVKMMIRMIRNGTCYCRCYHCVNAFDTGRLCPALWLGKTGCRTLLHCVPSHLLARPGWIPQAILGPV